MRELHKGLGHKVYTMGCPFYDQGIRHGKGGGLIESRSGQGCTDTVGHTVGH